MTLQKYIFPIFFGSNLLAQTETIPVPPFEFGFVHSTFTAASFQTTKPNPLIRKENSSEARNSKITEFQYGFGIGFFLWMPLNPNITFKPKAELAFSTTCLKHDYSVFSTSMDFMVSNTFAVALKKPDSHGIIYLARDMSCYLTSKQPYLLLGPQISMRKFDHGFINKGFQNEVAFGFCIGYGINYEFHGTKLAPEIYYTGTSTAQNSINDSKKIMHKITLAVNFF